MTVTSEEIEQTSIKYLSIKDCLSEKGRRLWAAAEAKAYGWGGVKLVVEATKISNATVHRGLRELETGEHKEYGIRRKGGDKALHGNAKRFIKRARFFGGALL